MFGQNPNLDLITRRKPSVFSYDSEYIISKDCRELGDILIFDHMVCPNLCTKILGFYKDYPNWEKSATNGEHLGLVSPEDSPRQSHQIQLGQHPNLDKIAYQIFSAGLSVVRSKFVHIDIEGDEGYSLLRYGPGGKYDTHIDYARSNNRVISSLIYLNGDYEGGELDFPRQNVRIKPTAGMVVFFPSAYTHPHASLPITSGIKYTIVTWFK